MKEAQNEEVANTRSMSGFWRIGVLLIVGITVLASVALLLGLHRSEVLEDGFFEVEIPAFFDGLPLSQYCHELREVRRNEFFGGLLHEFGVTGSDHQKVIEQCASAFTFNRIREGHQFHLFRNPEDCRLEWLIYEPVPHYSYKIRICGNPEVVRIDRPVEMVERKRSGVIRSSLWNAMIDGDMPIPLIMGMEMALECAIDFHHLQKGDHFRILYQEEQIDGQRVGLGNIQAISFSQGDSSVYAIYYEQDTIKGYYDLQGRPMKSMFLKAPVRFSRISSHYSPSRLHPILKVRRPHLGTDYAAPYGTEIIAVADGMVTEATRKGGNGIYVRIRHNSTYETQYLHMQGFAKGIRPGVRVRQGQVIGYVGATGLATGPHVCFRFWKNGRQVNHLRERLPEAKPMVEAMLPAYYEHRDRMMEILRSIPVQDMDPSSSEASDELTKTSKREGGHGSI
jgi:murein DD-endopeptidase MepM/ murein hydrolase activator NlpD